MRVISHSSVDTWQNLNPKRCSPRLPAFLPGIPYPLRIRLSYVYAFKIFLQVMNSKYLHADRLPAKQKPPQQHVAGFLHRIQYKEGCVPGVKHGAWHPEYQGDLHKKISCPDGTS